MDDSQGNNNVPVVYLADLPTEEQEATLGMLSRAQLVQHIVGKQFGHIS